MNFKKHSIQKSILVLVAMLFQLISNAQWTQFGLDIDGEAAGDLSGASVDISGDGLTLAIGAVGSGNDTGQVRVYVYDGTSWIQRGADINGEAAGDQNGWSVSLSTDGLTLAVGAIRNNGNGTDAGHVRVYRFNGAVWLQQGTDIDGEANDDFSGFSVSMSANGLTLAIGAPLNDGNGVDAGHVRVFIYDGTSWIQQGNDIDGEAAYDNSGGLVSLSLDGLTLAVGAKYNDGNGSNAGHVRVYTYTGTSWIQQGADINGEAIDDESGGGVSLSSDGLTLAIGARRNDGNGADAGHVRVYKYAGSVWVQQGIDIDGEAAGDLNGNSVSLSSDGSALAVGAILNSSHTGHVRVYRYNGGSWIQQGADIDGEAADDFSGSAVILSSDGLTIAIGALRNDGNGVDAGHVRVYSIAPDGINSEKFNNNINIYPNPASGSVIIEFAALPNNAKITISDIAGKNIYNLNKVTENKVTLSINNFSRGVYFVKVQSNKQEKIVKLVKE